MTATTLELIDRAMEALDFLSKATQTLDEALMLEHSARQAAIVQKANADDMEAEVMYEVIFTAEGKNAEQRDAHVKLRMSRERSGGALVHCTASLANAQRAHEDAKLELERAARRVKAAEITARLLGDVLRSIATA